MSEETEFVTNRQWDGLARRLERRNLKERQTSLSALAISNAANKYIVEIQSDRDGMIVRAGWRDAMRQRASE